MSNSHFPDRIALAPFDGPSTPGQIHAALFEVATSEVEFWFGV